MQEAERIVDAEFDRYLMEKTESEIEEKKRIKKELAPSKEDRRNWRENERLGYHR
jgi:hypothetical protein